MNVLRRKPSIFFVRVPEVGSVKRGLERIQKGNEPIPLLVAYDLLWRPVGVLPLFRIVVAEAGTPPCPETAVARIEAILLENVAAADLRFLVLGPEDLLDVDAMLAPFDLLHEDIDAVVVAVTEPAPARSIDEELKETGTRCIPSDPVTPVVGQDIAHERFVGVGRVENPVRLSGEP
jgi:hypothetical protein